MVHVLYLCTPLVLQHSLSVLPCCRGTALPLRMAAHVHPRSATSNAGHCLHPDAIHRWSAVQFSVPAHWAATGGGKKGRSLDHGSKVNRKSYNITTPMADFLYQQVLVVDLENNRLLRQVNASTFEALTNMLHVNEVVLLHLAGWRRLQLTSKAPVCLGEHSGKEKRSR